MANYSALQETMHPLFVEDSGFVRDDYLVAVENLAMCHHYKLDAVAEDLFIAFNSFMSASQATAVWQLLPD